MDDYEKAIELIEGKEPESKLPKKFEKKLKEYDEKKVRYRAGLFIVAFVFLVLCFVVYQGYVIYSEVTDFESEIIDEIKALNITVEENANITYGQNLNNYRGGWYYVKIFVRFNDAPWKDYVAKVWYNTGSQDFHVEEEIRNP